MRRVDAQPLWFSRRDVARFLLTTPLFVACASGPDSRTASAGKPPSPAEKSAPRPPERSLSTGSKESDWPFPELFIPTPNGYGVKMEPNKVTFLGPSANGVQTTITFSTDPAYRGEPLSEFARRKSAEFTKQYGTGTPILKDEYLGPLTGPNIEAKLVDQAACCTNNTFVYYVELFFLHKSKGWVGLLIAPQGIFQNQAANDFLRTYRGIASR